MKFTPLISLPFPLCATDELEIEVGRLEFENEGLNVIDSLSPDVIAGALILAVAYASS
jgi:hypothetical protein